MCSKCADNEMLNISDLNCAMPELMGAQCHTHGSVSVFALSWSRTAYYTRTHINSYTYMFIVFRKHCIICEAFVSGVGWVAVLTRKMPCVRG